MWDCWGSKGRVYGGTRAWRPDSILVMQALGGLGKSLDFILSRWGTTENFKVRESFAQISLLET